ncbi:hypothetical protein ABID50_002092, partial [Streptococcus parasuis]
HYDYTPSEGFMFVFIILWVRAEPSWMSFPLPFLVLNRVFYLTNFDYSYIMGKENLEKE